MNDYLSRNDEILRLIADDNINRAISRLLDFTRDFCTDSNSNFLGEALMVSANHKKLMREERQNLIDYQSANHTRNRIINQILHLCKDICSLIESDEKKLVIQNQKKELHIVKESNMKSNKYNSLKDEIQYENKQKQTKLYNNEFVTTKINSNKVCEVSNLSKKYSKSGFELKNISLSINSNEIIGVVGENGNGKTTFFKILAGKLKQDKGKISFPYLDENNPSNLNWVKIKNRIVHVEQELPRWYGSLVENLNYEASIHGIKGRKNKEDIDFILHRLGLVEYQNRKWNELSGGYKLRFALAKALVWKPSFILIDEPLANLDIHAQILVLNDLRDLANSVKYPISIVVSSQHLHEIEHISDKILFIKNGEALFCGKKEDLGKDRKYNFYEIQSNLSKEQLKDRLSKLSIIDILYDGLYYQVITKRSVQSQDFINKLSEESIELTYFRDISKSVKKLFI